MVDGLRQELDIDDKLEKQIFNDVWLALLPEGIDHIPSSKEIGLLIQTLITKYKDNPKQLFYVGFTYAIIGREISEQFVRIASAKAIMGLIGEGILGDKNKRRPEWAGP